MKTASPSSDSATLIQGPNTQVGFLSVAGVVFALVVLVTGLQQTLDHRQDRTLVQIEELAHLPPGDHLKPALLGYHHLGADVLWLKLVQVIGKRQNTMDEYEWMAHA
ncbi:MAG: hypothetical protein NNA23_10970, partial [Nitrospira sp.]|nr:hypothetical protein [Nitrospira sp.]